MIYRVTAYKRKLNRHGLRVTFKPLNGGEAKRKWWVADEDVPALGSLWEIDTRVFA